jgi:hypothetical protein
VQHPAPGSIVSPATTRDHPIRRLPTRISAPPGDRVPGPPTPEEILQRAPARQQPRLLLPREMGALASAQRISHEEIAAILRIRPGTVSALTRAHKSFR